MTSLNTAEGFIKVYDHVTDKLGKALPEPVFLMESTIYSLKLTGIASAIILVIGYIIALLFYNKIKYFGKRKITKFDANEKAISEVFNIDNNVKKSFCEKTFDEEGKLKEKVCYVRNNMGSGFWMTASVLILGLVMYIFISAFPMLRDYHYTKRVKYSNPFHKTFIEYMHKLLKM